jgi:Zn finger protein HypA/HybF involved in hydrogenase expression
MARELEARFFECPECERFTLLDIFTRKDVCPSCGSPNGRIITASKLEERLEAGPIRTVDLSPVRRERPTRQ